MAEQWSLGCQQGLDLEHQLSLFSTSSAVSSSFFNYNHSSLATTLRNANLQSWRSAATPGYNKFNRQFGREKRRLPPPPQSNVMYHESRYKTELCRQFEELGQCEYGDRCLFAHGMDELKNIPHRHPKFKTEKCSAFYENGFCSFGPRCSFIHEKPDAVQILIKLQESMRKELSASGQVSVVDRLTHEASLIPAVGDVRRLPVFQQIAP